MAQGWKIVASMACLDGGPPVREYYLVAIADREKAIAALRHWEKLMDAHIAVAGEATPDSLDWLDVRDGEILCVSSV